MSLMTDPHEMRSYSTKFRGHADEILAEATRAFASSQNISGVGWNGLANTASFDTMTDLNRAFKNIHDMMQFTSENLARNADAYEANEQDAAQKLKNV